MTISSEVSRENVIGDGNTDTYSFPFYIADETHLRLQRADETIPLILNTDYTVTGAGNAGGGSITLSAGNLDNGIELSIRRVVPITQITDIRNQGEYFASLHEDEFDLLTMSDQQQQDEIDRSLKFAESVDPADFDATIPADVVGQGGVTFITNPTGDALAVGPTSDEIANAQGYAVAAGASASLAEQWATETGSIVESTDYSAKEFAQGSQAATGGSSKNWAQQIGADVTGASAGDKSAKSWAQETGANAPADGSAKEWSIKLGTPVNGSDYSAKYNADLAALSAVAAAASAALASSASDEDDASTGSIVALSTNLIRSIRLTGAVTELAGLDDGADGRIVFVINVSGSDIPVRNEAAGAAAENRINTGSAGLDATLKNGGIFMFKYDATSTVWRIIGGAGGGSATVQTFAGSGGTASITTTTAPSQSWRYNGAAARNLVYIDPTSIPDGGRVTVIGTSGTNILTVLTNSVYKQNGVAELGEGSMIEYENVVGLGLVEVSRNGI